MYSLIIHFGIKKYEISLTIDIGLLHMYHLSVLPPKQLKIPLIVSRQISIPNVSPNLTDAHFHLPPRRQLLLGVIKAEHLRLFVLMPPTLAPIPFSSTASDTMFWGKT